MPFESVPMSTCVEHLVPSRWRSSRGVQLAGDKAELHPGRGGAVLRGTLPMVSYLAVCFLPSIKTLLRGVSQESEYKRHP